MELKNKIKFMYIKEKMLPLKNGKSFIYSFLNQSSILIFGFTGFLILITILDKDTFGTWVLFLGITSLVEMARNGFVQNAFIRYYVGENEETQSTILISSLILNFIITSSLIILLNLVSTFLVGLWKVDSLANLILIYSATAFVSVFNSQINFLMQAKNNFKNVFFLNLIKLVTFLGSLTYLSIFGRYETIEQLAYFQLFSVLAASVYALWLAREEINSNLKFSYYWICRLFHFGKYVCGTAITSILLNNTDNIMLGALLGPASVAVYNIAYRISNLIEVPIATIAIVVFPLNAKKHKDNGINDVRKTYEKSVAATYIIIIPFIIMSFLFAEEIILIIAGDDYLEAVGILKIVLTYCLFKPFLRQFGITLDVIGKPEKNLITIIILTVLNLFCNYTFINAFGLIGAALGTFISLLLGFILSQIILIAEIGTSIKTLKESFVEMFLKLKEIVSQIIFMIDMTKIRGNYER